jgi:hypothetical protein
MYCITIAKYAGCPLLVCLYVLQEAAANATGSSEAERLEAAWAHKSTLSRGLSMFTTSPVKAVKYLIAQQIVDNTPEVSAVACATSCGHNIVVDVH